MKRIFSFTLVLIMVLSLAACGGSGGGTVPSDAGEKAESARPDGDVSGAEAGEGAGDPAGDPSGEAAGSEEPAGDEDAAGSEEPAGSGNAAGIEAAFVDQVDLGAEEELIHEEAMALAASPVAVSNVLRPEASGTSVEQNAKAVVDYSNAKDGYVMVRSLEATSKTLKVILAGPTSGGKAIEGTTIEYVYNLPANGPWQTFPLACGSGEYTVKVMENTEGTKYAQVLAKSFSAALTDEFTPFLRPNQYVNYENAVNTVAKAAELIGGETDVLVKVKNIYDYVTGNLTYDKQKAATVKAGYLPELDAILAARTGICFDYAALMAGMLRSQGVPCKLVVGYVSTGCHAWISVYSPETGWIENTVYFDGKTWQRMDPTFASSSNNDPDIMKYIGDGSNYDAKYFY